MDDNEFIINLREVRISYPHLFEPYAYQGEGTPQYSAVFLLDKKQHSELIKQIAGQMKKLAAEAYRDKKLPPPDKLCLRDGDLSGRAENEGNWILSARETARPVVVNRDRTPLTAEDDAIYPGCVVNAKIRLWAQENKWGRRINSNLLGVQFVRDGDRLGNRGPRMTADEMFDSVEGFDEPEAAAAGDDPFG